MKLLKDILYKAGITDTRGSTNIALDNICFDSRKANEYSLFVAVNGVDTDGHLFINKAIEFGAHAIVCENFPEDEYEGITYVKVKDSKEALGIISSNFYDNPSEQINLVGITGTNGKSTIVNLAHQLFTSLGYKVGMLSTIHNKIGHKVIPSTHTTPDPVQLNGLLAQMVQEGCEYCFMEVSSHAIDQRRIAGLNFDIAAFTNITHDHLDYHKTFDAYIAAKKRLFDELKPNAYALVNKDDFHSEVMVQNSNAKVKTFSLKNMADYRCRILENQFEGLQLNLEGTEVWTNLVGGFNAYNLLAVYAIADLVEQDKMEVLTCISKLGVVEGRFQHIKSEEGIIGIVDYAHTPDALKNVLDTINDVRTGNEQVITLIGCGGNRDKEKRPLMAKIAVKNSDRVILTSDNPRNEDPEQILKEMESGIDKGDAKKVMKITDRKEAIKVACNLANKKDIILVAGKGHEKYQEINGTKKFFDDFEELSSMLKIQSN